MQNVDSVSVSDAISCDSHDCSLLNFKHDKYLTIIQQNIRSISRNFDNFLTLLTLMKINCDIIILTECWLYCNSDIPQLNGYTSYKSTKLYNQNDGIVVYYKNHIDISIIEPTFEEGNCLLITHPNITIVSIYRPPSFHSTDLFLQSLNNTLSSLSSCRNLSVIGDINIDIKNNTNDHRSFEYLNLNAYHGLLPAHNLATRFDASLDHVMLRSNLSAKTMVVNSTVTDHRAVMLCLESRQKKINPIVYTKLNNEKIKIELEKTTFDFIFECNDANTSANLFISFIQNLLNSNTTEHVIPNRKRALKPWITPGILRCIKNRDNLYKKHKSSPNDNIIKLTYTRYRNYCNTVIKKVKLAYYRDQINKAGKDNKKFWNIVKDITNTKINNTQATELLQSSAKPGENINLINSYFTNVGKELAEEIIKTNPAIPIDSNTSFSFHESSVVFLNTDVGEVEGLIMNLKNKCANGWDNISNLFLKEFNNFVVPPLVHIFNLCLRDGIFPKVFKHSIVHPIFKSGDRDRVCNYRPISILPGISKLIEKIINKRLLSYFESKNLFSPNQYGFRSGRSTDGAVHELIDYVVKNLDKSNKVIGIFLDLAKAFDTVSVPILINRMERYGIRGKQLDLLKDYLSERTQSTKIGEYISDPAPMCYGVPQGSILGPTLFLIYINDLLSLQPLNGRIISYADDTCLLVSASTWEAAQNAAQMGFDVINTWLKNNILTINAEKTKYIAFSMRKLDPEQLLNRPIIAHRCSINTSKNTCSCNKIELVGTIKYLGLIIDSNLSFKYHIEVLSTRLRKLIFIFKNLRYVMNFISLKRVYFALVQSLLSYCVTSWGGASKTIIKQIEVSQRAILKVCGFFPFRHSTELLYQHWQVLSVRQIFILNTVLKQHSMISNVGRKIVEARRSNKICTVLFTKKTYTRKYYCFLGGYLYNKINNILSIVSKNNYECKRIVTSWLLSLNYEETESLFQKIV